MDVQEAEENFDLALIASLEIDVVPQLGDPRVPDYVVTQLAKVLQRGSHLHELELEDESSDSPGSQEKTLDFKTPQFGTTALDTVVSRERFSYWCFDLLFLICSNTSRGTSSRVVHV